MRLFVASFFSEPMLDWLMKSGLSLSELFPARTLRLTRQENLHLTYQFLGEVPGSKVAQISKEIEIALRDVAAFEYSSGLVGVFPNKFRPRIMWIALEPVSRFQLLASKISRALEKVVTIDSKHFLPHVTLARFNENHSALSIVETDNVILPQFHILDEDRTINSVSLCQSELTPKGPIYSEISRYELNKFAKL
ncbi:MAG TPA: RNA 2',3'-cyclic phosphodiesterase [Anaerolineaceae bacterium]|nr:RNA 2',3'-cyclic phosphodiesterase [Anaerolineaceae bacterium]